MRYHSLLLITTFLFISSHHINNFRRYINCLTSHNNVVPQLLSPHFPLACNVVGNNSTELPGCKSTSSSSCTLVVAAQDKNETRGDQMFVVVAAVAATAGTFIHNNDKSSIGIFKFISCIS